MVRSRIPVEIYCFKFVVLVLVGVGGTLCCCTEASGLSCYRSRIDSLVCPWGNERYLCWMHLDRGRFLLLLLRLLLHGITMSNLVRFFEPSKCSNTHPICAVSWSEKKLFFPPPPTPSVFLFTPCLRSLEGVLGDPVCIYVCMYLLARSVFAAWKALCLSLLWN